MSASDTTVFALSDLGEVRVAIAASLVSTVESSRQGRAALDVARHLRVRAPSVDAPRRVAVLNAAPGALLLGASVRIVELPDDALHPLPAFVAEHLHALAIDRLVVLDDGFAYLVSPERLPRP